MYQTWGKMQLKKVLVIGDHSLNPKRARNILEIRNCQILEARSAEAGFLMVEKYLPDLILMGSQLSGVDKRKTFERIKSEPSLKDVPVINIADVSHDQIEKKITGGRVNCSTSQVDSDRIFETVNRFLDFHETKRQIPHNILRMQSQYYVSIFLINKPI